MSNEPLLLSELVGELPEDENKESEIEHGNEAIGRPDRPVKVRVLELYPASVFLRHIKEEFGIEPGQNSKPRQEYPSSHKVGKDGLMKDSLDDRV